MIFSQGWEAVTERVLSATAEQIEREPMGFNLSHSMAWLGGSDLTFRFLDAVGNLMGGELPERISLDTRSHMLMRGWYPAIPGWHHDDVDRGPSGQPDYDAPLDPERVMYTVVVDALDAPTGAMTEFLHTASRVSVPWPVPTDEPVYRYWDAHLEAECLAPRVRLKSGVIYRFTQADFHRAMPAEGNGWRWFARLTINPGRRPAPGKVRRQTQVYLPVTNKGW